MSKYQTFEEVPAWQEAARLYAAVSDLLESGNCPFNHGYRHQLERSALAIGGHIAEGFERAGRPEVLHFLGMARASAGEIRSMLAVVRGRPKLREFDAQLERIRALADSCARQLGAWLRAVEDGRRSSGEAHSPGGGDRRREEGFRPDPARESPRPAPRDLPPRDGFRTEPREEFPRDGGRGAPRDRDSRGNRGAGLEGRRGEGS